MLRARRNRVGNPGRVAPDAVDHHRGQRVEKMETHEIQSGLVCHNAALVLRLSIGAKHG